MPERGLTALLNAHHDKLNEHTLALKDIKQQLDVLQASVSALEEQTAKVDEDSGLRAGLRDWIANIRELM